LRALTKPPILDRRGTPSAGGFMRAASAPLMAEAFFTEPSSLQ
jgi:hypothetical protein